MIVFFDMNVILEGHPERRNCRYCVAFKKCLLANARDNDPCNRFSMAQSHANDFRCHDRLERDRRQREEDRVKYALENCPFCDGPSHFEEKPEDWGYHPAYYCVSCDDHDCRGFKYADGGDSLTKEDAARKWNRSTKKGKKK